MKSQIIYLMLLCLSVAFIISNVNGVEIEINQGILIGKQENSYEGRTFYSFRSIPYAQPPVGKLRFEDPIPATNWSGVLDARNEGEVCAQAAIGIDEGVEDCLHLSVFTPMLPQKEKIADLPVLVWLHGGAFVTGGAKEYSPHLLMDRPVVLVIPQYRLGMLGFFSSNSQFAPGNYGLLDQLTALRWVKQNIRYFGGDPNQVTLGGDCAGGISSVWHMISPMSEGLFHRVISLTGSPLSTWAIHPRHNRFGLIMCNNINCPPHDFKMMIECFRDTPLSTLLEKQKFIVEARDIFVGNSKLAPVVQDIERFNKTGLFLENHPLKMLIEEKYTKVPVLLSVTRDVGSYLVDIALYDFLLEKLEENPNFLEELIPMLVQELYIFDHETEHKKFQDFYLPNWDTKNVDNNIPGLAKMLGDGSFTAAILALAKILSKSVDTRLLRFDYEEGPKLFDIRHSGRESSPIPIPSTSVSHGDELFFLFPMERINLTKEHEDVVHKMLNIVEDFVYGRTPLGSWPLFTSNGLETTVITAKGDIEKGVKFTDEAHDKFLQFIIKKQFKNIFEELEDEKVDISEWKHDEL